MFVVQPSNVSLLWKFSCDWTTYVGCVTGFCSKYYTIRSKIGLEISVKLSLSSMPDLLALQIWNFPKVLTFFLKL
jgi:hypothetical protein